MLTMYGITGLELVALLLLVLRRSITSSRPREPLWHYLSRPGVTGVAFHNIWYDVGSVDGLPVTASRWNGRTERGCDAQIVSRLGAHSALLVPDGFNEVSRENGRLVALCACRSSFKGVFSG